jgi:hypothetical protein
MGLGVELVIGKHDSTVVMDRALLIAVRAGLQPTFGISASEEEAFFQRLRKLSLAQLYQNNGAWFVQMKNNND